MKAEGWKKALIIGVGLMTIIFILLTIVLLSLALSGDTISWVTFWAHTKLILIASIVAVTILIASLLLKHWIFDETYRVN